MKKIKYVLITVAIIAIALFVRNKDRRRRFMETFVEMRDKYSDNLNLPEDKRKQMVDIVYRYVK